MPDGYPLSPEQEQAVPQFARWERVQWGNKYTFAVVHGATMVAGRWMYQIVTERDHMYTVSELDLSKARQVPPQKSVTIDEDHKVGEIVTLWGHRYKVVSMRDADTDTEEFHCHMRLEEEEQ